MLVISNEVLHSSNNITMRFRIRLGMHNSNQPRAVPAVPSLPAARTEHGRRGAALGLQGAVSTRVQSVSSADRRRLMGLSTLAYWQVLIICLLRNDVRIYLHETAYILYKY